MLNRILLIVPTRNRRDKVVEFYSLYKENSSITDLVFSIDDDDRSYDGLELEGCQFIVCPKGTMNSALNYTAIKFCSEYRWLAFMGDDHRIRTKNWDVELTKPIPELGVSYGNDLLQGKVLATAVVLTSNIVRAIGYMAPPRQKHLYLDNFWMEIGNRLNRLHYNNDVILEHMHYIAGKSVCDEIYSQVNSPVVFNHDRAEYEKYLSEEIEEDLKKIYDTQKK